MPIKGEREIEFVNLVPKDTKKSKKAKKAKKATAEVAHPVHESEEIESLKREVEEWKSRYYSACKVYGDELASLKKMLRSSRETIEAMAKAAETVRLAQQSHSYSSSYDGDPDDDDIPVSTRSKYSEFTRGLGWSMKPGEDPKLYRLYDPDGDLIPKTKFDGARVEVQPGCGFRIGLRFKKI